MTQKFDWDAYRAEMDRIGIYHIYVDQSPLPTTYGTLIDACRASKELHRAEPRRYHEVYREYTEDYKNTKKGDRHGISQYKPGDCPDCRIPAKVGCTCNEG